MADPGTPEASDGLFAWSWRLEVEHEEARALAKALGPESQGHHALEATDDRLVATGQGGTGQSLHTVDDLLACLTAAVESLDATGSQQP